jgi:hypothetical protein
MERPNKVTDEHLSFLDELRESGETNMFGASPYIVKKFGVPIKEAQRILIYWMESFENPNREKGIQ